MGLADFDEKWRRNCFPTNRLIWGVDCYWLPSLNSNVSNTKWHQVFHFYLIQMIWIKSEIKWSPVKNKAITLYDIKKKSFRCDSRFSRLKCFRFIFHACSLKLQSSSKAVSLVHNHYSFLHWFSKIDCSLCYKGESFRNEILVWAQTTVAMCRVTWHVACIVLFWFVEFLLFASPSQRQTGFSISLHSAFWLCQRIHFPSWWNVKES